jgi:D-alanyl-D-alanine carboxypeptidase
MKDYVGVNYFFSRCFTIVIAAGLLLTATDASARYASIVIDYDSGKVLHAVNPDTRNYPASLTKMMTVYLAFEAVRNGKLRMAQPLPISAQAENARPTKLGLKRGSTITLRQAILAIVTKSANDAAVVIGEAIAGSEEKFSRKMTRRARTLGMQRTVFRNASGLPNKRQLSSARDMAILSTRLIRDHPKRYAIFSTAQFEFRGKQYYNHNMLLATYPGADGLKTGYTRASGYNLAVSAKRGKRRIIGIVFGGKTAKARNRHMRRLLDQAFAKIGPKDKPSDRLAQNKAPTPKERPMRLASLALPLPGKFDSELPAFNKPWGIQVGAFAGRKPAHQAARKAARQVKKTNRNVEVVVAPARKGGDLIYRARLVGLSQSSANQACKQLRRKKLNCIPVPPSQL